VLRRNLDDFLRITGMHRTHGWMEAVCRAHNAPAEQRVAVMTGRTERSPRRIVSSP